MLRTIKFILNHPLTKGSPISGVLNAIRWQLVSRINKGKIVYRFTPHSKLYVWKGLTGATGNIYCGLHEFEDMAFLLHFLRNNDLFVDVGANIGSYTMLASAEIGAKSISIEPIPDTFKNLTQNIQLNEINDKVTAFNIGVGSTKSQLKFTKSFDTGNHVVSDDTIEHVSVCIDTLDAILKNECPALLKIDVEGFELEVLKGAKNTLSCKSIKAVIIELNRSGARYGYNDDDVHEKLIESGFKTYQYLPFERKLVEAARNVEHNTLYIRDYTFVADRIASANAITVKNKTF